MDTRIERSRLPPQEGRGWRIGVVGRYWLLLTLVLLAIGAYKGANLLMLLAYLMALVLLANVLAARRSLRGLQSERRLTGPLFAGEPYPVEVQILNTTRKVRRGLLVEDEGPFRTLSWFILRLDGHGRQRLTQNVILSRRGRHAWGPVRVVSGAPFGLVRCCAVLQPGTEVLVLPRRGWLHRGRFRSYLHSRGLLRERIRRRSQAHREAQDELHGLRSFQPGDSPRWIHWRTSARRGELMVREMADLPSENLMVVLDPTPPAPGPSQRRIFEGAVSLAATICWEWCRHAGLRLILAVAGSQPVVVDGLTGPTHARRLLEQLALVEMGPAPGVALLAQLAAAALPPAAVVIVAAGPSALAGPLGPALQRPINSLDASDLAALDFYEPPARVQAQVQ